MQNDKQIEKLKKQVEQYERKGYFDTAAHIMLTRLLEHPADGVPVRNAKKVIQEKKKDGE